ncbi:hypothetical protein HY995_03600 [Candidatus Micrarchaeota archaeon]|nr:hypothetical protein [Candidatus Micrarchaeota archaeon]MBI5177145.1 hypothetical protein [Candidatus Micrarchaeota archaeon]
MQLFGSKSRFGRHFLMLMAAVVMANPAFHRPYPPSGMRPQTFRDSNLQSSSQSPSVVKEIAGNFKSHWEIGSRHPYAYGAYALSQAATPVPSWLAEWLLRKVSPGFRAPPTGFETRLMKRMAVMVPRAGGNYANFFPKNSTSRPPAPERLALTPIQQGILVRRFGVKRPVPYNQTHAASVRLNRAIRTAARNSRPS